MWVAARVLRRFFARFLALKSGVQDARIEQAFAETPREAFAGPGPWQIKVPGAGYLETPDSDPAYLYQDWLVALDASRGINIGEPGLHARCLEALELRDGEEVVHIGAGAGYYTAILAALVGPTGRVHAYEIDPALAARARGNLENLPAVHVYERSGIGDGLAQADAVYVNASATHPSWSWLDALRPGRAADVSRCTRRVASGECSRWSGRKGVWHGPPASSRRPASSRVRGCRTVCWGAG